MNERLGSWMAGGNSTDGRKDKDFYPTPWEVTQGLINEEGERLPRQIWEPCCGDGAMSKVLIASGRAVYSSDIEDRGYGDVANFLTQQVCRFPAICTNPPFELAEEIIRHAHSFDLEYLALLLNSSSCGSVPCSSVETRA